MWIEFVFDVVSVPSEECDASYRQRGNTDKGARKNALDSDARLSCRSGEGLVLCCSL